MDLTPGHLVGGFPEFDGWPRWNICTHQAMYEDWLLRADHQGGLQLMVMLPLLTQISSPITSGTTSYLRGSNR